MKTRTCQPIFALLAVTVAIFAAGCTHVIKPPAKAFTGYAPTPKANTKAALVLSDQFRTNKWEKHVMGDTFVIPIGANLCVNAEHLCRQLFSEVTVASMAEQAQSAGAQVILTPALAYINRTTGATSFGDSIVSIKVEWTLTDAAGKTLWAETISGEGKGSTGWTNPENIVKAAVEDLFKKSHQALSSSTAIKKFTTER